jgi:hypothetical protein
MENTTFTQARYLRYRPPMKSSTYHQRLLGPGLRQSGPFPGFHLPGTDASALLNVICRSHSQRPRQDPSAPGGLSKGIRGCHRTLPALEGGALVLDRSENCRQNQHSGPSRRFPITVMVVVYIASSVPRLVRPLFSAVAFLLGIFVY